MFVFLSKVRSNNRREEKPNALKKAANQKKVQGVALSQYLFSPDIGADRRGFKVGSGADRCANSVRPVCLVSPAAILCRLAQSAKYGIFDEISSVRPLS